MITKDLTAYADWAMTINGSGRALRLGAGGRAVTTDCHDAFGAQAASVPTLTAGLAVG